MFLFKSEIPATKKPESEHPWAHRIKDVYSNRYKYAHNSIRNPIYPKKKEKYPPGLNRIKFTIIGDRITKEFIYCVNLVKGLYKYRKKSFDAPVIRGVTTIEWPSVWNDLKIKYAGLAFCLRSSVAVLINDNFLGGEKELKELVETKYTYHLCLDYVKEGVAEFAKFTKGSGRPCVYMHIAINEDHIGTLIFMLYSDIVPHTCENFLRLCKETRGGYSGTIIHRIVKDGWIQGGGFGLKDTHLDCENFIVPHDRRGVLCMANAGRHIECSTQFFVLLQPAQWMAHKYVAFGQLIEGKGTLEKIEAVPTWYESPTSEIIIYRAGIFNMDCHDIMINRGTNQYIDSHIEDLNALGELLYELLLDNVFLTAELREIERLKEQGGEGGEDHASEDGAAGVRETQRFKKEDIEKQILTSKAYRQAPSVSRQTTSVSRQTTSVSRRPKSAVSAHENNDFDVESYDPEYEAEETDYMHQSLVGTPSLIVKPTKPYYLPLTDVPYPGEKDSHFDLKRFLQGDYCLESDLLKISDDKKMITLKERLSLAYPSDLFNFDDDSDDSDDDSSMDSDEDKEIKKYLKAHVDRVSFAGGVIKNIAKTGGKINLLFEARKSELISDDALRRIRMASVDYRSREYRDKKVSISVPNTEKDQQHSKIKRRQTGFVRTEDLEKIHIIQSRVQQERDDEDDHDDDDDDDDNAPRKVRIAAKEVASSGRYTARRPTGYARPGEVVDSDTDVRQSVLVRLFDDVKSDDEPPTLKDYKPMSESHPKNLLLTFSPNYRIKSEENSREKYRHSITVEHGSLDHVLNLQHGKKVARKISSDYVKTIDHIEHRLENSIRSVEYAKTRPAITVHDYQSKNKKYQDGHRKSVPSENIKTFLKPDQNYEDNNSKRGLRLPGDSPLYSHTDIKEYHHH